MVVSDNPPQCDFANVRHDCVGVTADSAAARPRMIHAVASEPWKGERNHRVRRSNRFLRRAVERMRNGMVLKFSLIA